MKGRLLNSVYATVVSLLLLLVGNTAIAQQSVGELKEALTGDISDSLRLAYLQRVAVLSYNDEIDTAIVYMKEATALSRVVQDDRITANTLRNTGVFYYYKNDYPQAIKYYEKAIEQFHTIDTIASFAETYRTLGMCHYEMGDYATSIKKYYDALDIFENLNDSIGIARTLNSIGSSLEMMNKLNEALINYNKSIQIKKAIQDTSGVSVGLVNIGNVYRKSGKLDLAMEHYRKALEIGEQLNDNRLIVDALNLWAKGLVDQGNEEEAEQLLKRALSIFESYHNDFQLLETCKVLSEIYIKEEQYDKALPIVNENLELANIIQANDVFKDVYLDYAKTLHGLGRHEEAYDALNRHMVLKDSIFTRENVQAVGEIQARYESEKQEKEIAELKYQNELEHVEHLEQEQLRNIFIAGFIVILGIVIVLYWLNRTRKRNNQLLRESLGEKEVLLKEVHHRVKNNFQLISSLLNLQSDMVADKAAQEALSQGKNRIHSMALVHENLYKTKNLSKIELQHYLGELVETIIKSFRKDERAIIHHIDVGTVRFDVETSIRLGLIVNELVSNSMKYAFVDRTSGNIRIRLIQQEDNEAYVLTIADDGIGLPEGFDLEKLNSLGLELVQLLVAQMRGKLIYTVEGGTSYTITFWKS